MSDDTPAEKGFDPSRYLTKLGRGDYLEVKWRLVWLREEAPDATLETQAVTIENDFAVFRAKVTLPTGGSATGYGSESMGDFRDYIEKAETKAIGRALAALGFGTQFCPDFDFGAGATDVKVVDSPVDFANVRGRRDADASQPVTGQRTASASNPISSAQMKFLNGLAKDLGLLVIAPDGSDHHDEQAMNAETRQRFGKAVTELSAREASELIEDWKARPKVARR